MVQICSNAICEGLAPSSSGKPWENSQCLMMKSWSQRIIIYDPRKSAWFDRLFTFWGGGIKDDIPIKTTYIQLGASSYQYSVSTGILEGQIHAILVSILWTSPVHPVTGDKSPHDQQKKKKSMLLIIKSHVKVPKFPILGNNYNPMITV